MSQPVQIWFEEGQEGGELVRRLVCENIGGSSPSRLDFWWRFPEIDSLPTPPVLDSLLGGPLLWAAMSAQDIVVHGPVSAGGLYNLNQFIEIRQRLSPERYPRVIELRPDNILEVTRDAREPSKAIAALSGGLDSTFTVVRHGLGLAGEASIPIVAMVMVHGFDASPDRMDLFDAMRRRAEPTIRLVDVPLYVVRTNSKMDARTWPQSAVPLTVSALSHFGHLAPIALVAAGTPYGSSRLGLGHPAVVDALASGDWLRVVMDGSGFGRAEKVEMLAPFFTALSAIKVCWEGDDPSVNCGTCEKCVMTRLNFLAAGIRNAPCFDTPLTPELIANLRMRSMNEVRALFRLCWSELEARKCSGPEVDLLRRRLSRVPPDIIVNKVRQLFPPWARRLIRRTVH